MRGRERDGEGGRERERERERERRIAWMGLDSMEGFKVAHVEGMQGANVTLPPR